MSGMVSTVFEIASTGKQGASTAVKAHHNRCFAAGDTNEYTNCYLYFVHLKCFHNIFDSYSYKTSPKTPSFHFYNTQVPNHLRHGIKTITTNQEIFNLNEQFCAKF